MNAREIIRDARELDPAFTEARHPTRVAMHHLSRLQRRLVAEWVKLEEASYIEIITATFPLADFDAGVELLEDELESGESVADPLAMTAIQRPLDMWLRGADKPVNLDLIRWGDRNRRVQGRAAYIVENTLFFTGRVEDWTDVERVELTYTPTPGAITDLDADLILPITAEEALVSSLGAFFARRSNEKELARARREYIAEAADAEALWLDELQRREGATISRTTAAW